MSEKVLDNAETEFLTVQPGWAFEPELDFTNTYVKYRNASKFKRELECLRMQLSHMLQPLVETDLIAGRTQYFTVGLHHIVYGDGPSKGIDRAGYCFDRDRIEEKLQLHNPESEEREAVRKMCDFWESEHTVARTRRRFTSEMDRVAPTDSWMDTCAVVHPLYRIAEFQPDHGKLVRLGLPGIRRELHVARQRSLRYGGNVEFIDAMIASLELVETTIEFYISDVERALAYSQRRSMAASLNGNSESGLQKRSAELSTIRDSLSRIRSQRPETFRDALQLLWIFNVTAGLADFNRIDVVLGDLYAHDIDAGLESEEQVIELLVSLWSIIDDIYHRNTRVIIGGRSRPNEDSADRLAIAVMESARRHRGEFPQFSLRHYEGIDEAVFDKALDVLAEGTTYPVLYNDDINVPSVAEAFDVSTEVALDYSFFGCGEYILGHRSIGTPNVIINLAKILELTINNGRDLRTGEQVASPLGELHDFGSFEELFEAYDRHTRYYIEQAALIQELVYDVLSEDTALLLQGMLMNDVIESGLPVLEGGIQHLGGTIESYGNVTTADSLVAIRDAVFDRNVINADQLVAMLRADFVGSETERSLLMKAPKYGNDDDRADQMAARVHEHICRLSRKQKLNTRLDSFLVVEINNSANAVLGQYVAATPDGRRAGDILSNGNGPVQGRDTSGITALLNSLTKMRHGIHAGITQNLKFSTRLFSDNRDQVRQLLLTYFELGGTQANITVVAREDLERAMEEPEKYRNIIVRIGGYSCRFVDLDRRAQEDMIRRTTY